MRHASLMCLILTFTAADLPAQVSAASEAVRIRLVPASADWEPMIGTAVSMGLDTIQLVLDGKKDTVKVLTAGLDRVERSMSRRSNFARGLMVGGLIGAAAGGVAAYALGSSDMGDEGTIAPYMVPAGIGAGALLGGILGGIWGANSHRERWAAMPTITTAGPSSPRASAAAVRLGVAARLTF